MLDEDEAMLISALAPTLDPSHTQFAQAIAAGGALNSEHSNTRVVDGACIFLNRPGFSGGHGCALHHEAVANDESPIDYKPSVCWQLPIKIDRDGEVGSATLRRWRRSDWGSDGESMAFCCTEGHEAFSGHEMVIDSLAEELGALLGSELVERIRDGLTT